MSRRTGILLGVLVCTALAGLAVHNYDPQEIEIPLGLQGEARRNDWLAAERILRRMGVPAQRLYPTEWLESMPEPGGVLMLAPSGIELIDERRDALHRWLDGGGHLIVAVNATRQCAEDETAHWLDAFVAGFVSATHCNAPFVQGGARMDVTLADATLGVTIAAVASVRVTAGALGRVLGGDGHGECFVQGAYGRGTITLLCDESLFDNLKMARDDRAELLVRLVRQAGHPGFGPGDLRVWLDHWGPALDGNPSLARWIWQRAPVTVAAAALAIALGLWAAVRRLGPRIALPDPARREIMEHIEACGRFAWRQKAERGLLVRLRASLDEALARRVPGWRGLPRGEQVQRLAELTGMEHARIAAALSPPTDAKSVRRQFAPIVHTLESLRRTL